MRASYSLNSDIGSTWRCQTPADCSLLGYFSNYRCLRRCRSNALHSTL